tara:strand:+ start:25524 stop:26093 length:570 start_codon:yes stop_codon:yes gene_type:complete
MKKELKVIAEKVATLVVISRIVHQEHVLPKNLTFAMIQLLKSEALTEAFTALELTKISRLASSVFPEFSEEVETVMDAVIAYELDDDTEQATLNYANPLFGSGVIALTYLVHKTEKDKEENAFSDRLESSTFILARSGLYEIVERMKDSKHFDFESNLGSVVTAIFEEIKDAENEPHYYPYNHPKNKFK